MYTPHLFFSYEQPYTFALPSLFPFFSFLPSPTLRSGLAPFFFPFSCSLLYHFETCFAVILLLFLPCLAVCPFFSDVYYYAGKRKSPEKKKGFHVCRALDPIRETSTILGGVQKHTENKQAVRYIYLSTFVRFREGPLAFQGVSLSFYFFPSFLLLLFIFIFSSLGGISVSYCIQRLRIYEAFT